MAHTSDCGYEVFINHRGPDVKKGFAGHLYRALYSQQIRVFLDKPEMKKGDILNSQIVGAIQTASVHVAIFSENYAESKWCLQELVLMVESLRSGATIIPVFHDVKPAALRSTEDKDRGYGEGLHKLKVKTDEETIKRWKEALSTVADIIGFELEAYNGEEAELVENIVEHVSKIVKKPRFSVPKYEIGLDAKVRDFEDKVLSRQHQSGKPQVVGIVGSGGVGKTTVANKFFHKESPSYLNSCFFSVNQNADSSSLHSLFGEVLKRLTLSDVQINSVGEVKKLFEEYEPSLEMIQKFSSLVILDGIDDFDQWNALLPIQKVLHPESLILITSRNRNVLTDSGVEAASIYQLDGLNTQHSRKLFCFHAFHTASPLQGYQCLVDEFLTVCRGLPLLLKVIGASFYKKDISDWEGQLYRFQPILPHETLKKLKFSYDALNIEEKDIFLDIASYFIGETTDAAIIQWRGPGWGGLRGFQSLLEKRLVEVDSENCINMHDHLKDLGKTIVEETGWRRNNGDLFQESHVITELGRDIGDLLQQSAVIKKQVRGLMLMILIIIIILIWSMLRRREQVEPEYTVPKSHTIFQRAWKLLELPETIWSVRGMFWSVY